MSPLLTCAQCRFSERPCGGVCRCRVDMQPLHVHAERRECPKGFYSPGVGDRLAALTRRTGIAGLIDRLLADLNACDVWRAEPITCGCGARRAAMNHWWATTWPAMVRRAEETWPARATRSAWSRVRRLFNRPSIDN